MKQQATGVRGFTLVEILVVLLIATIVLAVLVSVLGSSFEILRTGETRAQLNNNTRVALDYICSDISSASYIPLAADRDLNGYPDEDDRPADGGHGYDESAVWRVAWWDNNVPVVASSYWMSEAWGDRVMATHDSSVIVNGQRVENRSFTVPKVLRTGTGSDVAEYRSFFRLAVPATTDMPYYLALEWDRNGDGVVDPLNTGFTAGQIVGYPEIVPVGPHKETAAVIQDLFYKYRGEDSVRRVRQIPVSSNITRIKFEYMHEVPVYVSREGAADIEIAYQDLNDGDVYWLPESDTLSNQMENRVPLVSHWELRTVDVAYNADYTDQTRATYIGTYWRLADQYPEGLNDAKRDGTHVTPNTGMGLGELSGSGVAGWNCSNFYDTSTSGVSGTPDNAPIDRLAYVTTSIGLDGSPAVEGGLAMLRPDTGAIHGSAYYNSTSNPTGIGDMGDADGIPDGDGVPDDPVPGWWLPYLRAVRVTVVGTPRQVMQERRSKSGKPGDYGTIVYYRLDSPVPYQDADRTVPLYHQRKDYIGSGRDLVLTRTVPVNFTYRAELVTDPFAAELSDNQLRRVELNYFRGTELMFADPLDPDVQIRARNPVAKLEEKDPL